MNLPKDNQCSSEFPMHEDLLKNPFASSSPSYSNNPYTHYYQVPRKRKWIAGVVSLIIPGTGHFYLGFMQRGLFIMSLIILDIFAITALATQDEPNVPFITLFSLIIPVIYFYNVFDALRATDQVNRRIELGDFEQEEDHSLHRLLRGSNLGVILISLGVLFFLLSTKPSWFIDLFHLMGSYIGSVVLIAAGLGMFVLESRKNKSE
ncbi:hypothetical protein GK047_24475 [Paenibacillus sp. SYP-B3998]|uniref:Uncharacterized protein n=1 Tax=Paenibacillus sp. SYP-B3998 TaxID=2678564 RepID=A0A6G4A3R0_9BACL|nr:hypothetical protein [Paenibacillus sp. SYP-B3998]NEW09136.1 hypothetical protein [Paenibacillus sp. SYP-B3998]